jgi:hypothetical protein
MNPENNGIGRGFVLVLPVPPLVEHIITRLAKVHGFKDFEEIDFDGDGVAVMKLPIMGEQKEEDTTLEIRWEEAIPEDKDKVEYRYLPDGLNHCDMVRFFGDFREHNLRVRLSLPLDLEPEVLDVTPVKLLLEVTEEDGHENTVWTYVHGKVSSAADWDAFEAQHIVPQMQLGAEVALLDSLDADTEPNHDAQG